MTTKEVLYMMSDQGAYFHFDENGNMTIRCESGKKIGAFLRAMLIVHKSEMKRDALILRKHLAEDLQIGKMFDLHPPVWHDSNIEGRISMPTPLEGSLRPKSTETPTGEVAR